MQAVGVSSNSSTDSGCKRGQCWQQCLDGTHPGIPFLPTSGHSPVSYPVTTFKITSGISQLTGFVLFSTLTPYC
ncbi:hypothetical protein QTO34_002659 [Cnephaeus nilssonii]|uniref:Uncharacterized protein n=1 Tax=Cnephaeus nilssonii TaxID=3371016 RepID=A0AA40HSP0_CNENI|nr:hypothetical protein QTO34_002659 [Eptesicus nilssonii]